MLKSATAVIVLALGGMTAAHADNSQQTRMTTCNAQAGDQKLTGDARKSFMKTCLSGGGSAPAAKALTPQQQKMKTCNADATTKGLKGADRKAYMKTCLSGSSG
ncbi:MAG TPA: PsiF family protein [Steroidobacteraceae bacterium]|nr:PsiF family protein [Steroidobacteraceae bacterium]